MTKVKTTSLDLFEISNMRHVYLRHKWNRHGTKNVVVVTHHLIFFSVGCSTHGFTYHVECQALLQSFPFACNLNLGLQLTTSFNFWLYSSLLVCIGSRGNGVHKENVQGITFANVFVISIPFHF
jgi:hypothetical protein